MKFKIAIISLLTVIATICAFTSFTLIEKTNKQLDLQKLQTEIEINSFEFENFERIVMTEEQTMEKSLFYEWTTKYHKICEQK